MTCEVARVVRPLPIRDENLIFSNLVEDEFHEWVSTREYILEDKVIFKHKIYECVQAHKGQEPARKSSYWVEVQSTNRWAMFDHKVGAQSINEGPIEIELGNFTGFIDTIALLNLSALRATVIIIDDLEGEVFRQETTLVDYGCSNLHQYFFRPIIPQRDLVISGLPPYAGATVRILLESTEAATVKVGEVILGTSLDIGTPLWGTNLAIRDFSEKTFDTYGNIDIVELDWAKRPELDLEIQTNRVNYVMDELVKLRATPCLYIGHKEFNMTIAYGFYKDLMVVLSNPTTSSCTLTIEALT